MEDEHVAPADPVLGVVDAGAQVVEDRIRHRNQGLVDRLLRRKVQLPRVAEP